jgi:hypothetical protein
MEKQADVCVKHNDENQQALERLLDAVRVELAGLLASKQNFKLIINGSAGRSFTVEVSKYMRL